jgi:hypothetical protein
VCYDAARAATCVGVIGLKDCHPSTILKLLACRLVPDPEAHLYDRPGHMAQGWLELFMRFMNDSFPHDGHILVNTGKLRTTSCVCVQGVHMTII